MSTEQEFRQSLRGFNTQSTSRGGVQQPQSGASAFFSNFSSGASDLLGNVRSTVGAYVPIGGEDQEQPWYQLSAFERMVACAVCILAGSLCFLLAFLLYLPMIALFPSKFATTFTIGSIMMLLSIFFLKGPVSHFKHMISRERMAFSAAYVASMILTLWAALGARSYLLSVLFSIIQLVALVWYLVSYFPGGVNTLRYGSIVIGQSVRSYLPT